MARLERRLRVRRPPRKDRGAAPLSVRFDPARAGPYRRTVARADVAAHLALAGWLFAPDDAAVKAEVEAALGPGDRFDPAEVHNRFVADGLDDPHSLWRTRHVATGRRLVTDLAGEGPRRFALRFTRAFPPGRPGARLRLPLPLADAHLTELEVAPHDNRAEISPARLELRRPDAAAITLGVDLAFTAHPRAPHGDPPAPDQWLASREGPIHVTAAVAELAARLAQPDPLATVEAFHDHLLDSFACGVVPPDTTIDRVLETRWYDCRLAAALLASLCRARAIPARLVGGWLLWSAPTEHYWMEAWIAGHGWTPFDLLAWDLSAGGRDPAWRSIYAGQVDYRMKTQRFPDVFTGSPGVHLTPPWHRLLRRVADGAETRLVSATDGAPIYTDTLQHI